MADKSMQKILSGVDRAAAAANERSGVQQEANMQAAQRKVLGPEDRVRDLKALRIEVLKKKPTDSYDPKMQLQSIDHEIARLTRPPK